MNSQPSFVDALRCTHTCTSCTIGWIKVLQIVQNAEATHGVTNGTTKFKAEWHPL